MASETTGETGGNIAEKYYETVTEIAQYKGKLVLPENLAETIMAVDKLQSSFKKQFVCFSAILSVLFKQKVIQQRKSSLQEIKDNPKMLKTSNKKAHNNLSRTEAVPEVMKKCKSIAAKSAIAMFCLQPYKENIRRDVLFAIILDSFNSVNDIIKLATDSIKVIKEAITGKTAGAEDHCRSLIRTLLETSDVLRDKSYSKLAMAVHPQYYLMAVKMYVEKNKFATICPYDALISKYIQTCIASKSQASERGKIINQFEVNSWAIVDNMISSLPGRRETSKSVKFEESRMYHVFEGPVNFPRDLTYKYKKINGKYYQLVTYKDCLYDVIGTDDELFSNKTWPERLDSIDYIAKIIITKKSGAELNEYNGNATLTTAWMENDRFHCKHYTFIHREKNANKSV